MTIKVIVDSSAGLGPELAKRWGIVVVPFYVGWDGKTNRDGTLGAEFYRQLEGSDSNPLTSAPNPADFVAAIDQSLGEGHSNVVIVTPTPTMTGVNSHAIVAAREFDEGTVSVFDSGQGAGAQALIAISAARAAQSGTDLNAVTAAAELAARETEIHMAVNTLKFLRRSGRISAAQATMGQLIRMRPILTFVDNRLQVVAKPRTTGRAISWLLERLGSVDRQAEHVLVMYADTPERAEELAEEVGRRLNPPELDMAPVSGVVGGNTGPGLLGVAVRWRSEAS